MSTKDKSDGLTIGQKLRINQEFRSRFGRYPLIMDAARIGMPVEVLQVWSTGVLIQNQGAQLTLLIPQKLAESMVGE